jgi:integrase
MCAPDLKPLHASDWMDRKALKRGARRAFVTALKRAFTWAEEQGLTGVNPVAKLKKPKGRKRHRTVTEAERQEILGAIRDSRFKDFVFAMQETGYRPGEVSAVTADDVDLERGLWVLDRHKTDGKTGEARVVYLTPAMAELSKRLVEQNPEGPLFRGWGNRPYSINAIRCRFRRLRAKLPLLMGVVAYSYRHSFASAALERGVGIAHVAELLGHRSTDMVMRHYGHLDHKVKHMRDAATKAAGARSFLTMAVERIIEVDPFSRDGRFPEGGHPCTALILPTPRGNGSSRFSRIATTTATRGIPGRTTAAPWPDTPERYGPWQTV